jgi:hypothetical protein
VGSYQKLETATSPQNHKTAQFLLLVRVCVLSSTNNWSLFFVGIPDTLQRCGAYDL